MIKVENNVKQYLLGTLGEKEQLALEQRLLLDDGEFEQLLIAEDELTDAYTRNELSSFERERFEQHFLSAPEHQQKLRFAQAFQRHLGRAAEQGEPSPRGWLVWLGGFLNTGYPVRGYALSAACVLIALGGLWLGFKAARLQNEVTQMRAQSSAPRPTEQELRQRLAELRASSAQLEQALQDKQTQATQLEKALAQAQQAAPHSTQLTTSSVVAFVLTPGALTRDAGAPGARNQITIPAGAHTAKLQLELEQDQYPSYRAVLHTQGGAILKRWNEAQPQQTRDGQRLLLQVPITLLPAGSYYFQLEGLTAEGRAERADQFHFHVARK